MTVHPRLSVSAVCSLRWSFDQDFALWSELGLHTVGLLFSKIEDCAGHRIERLGAAGMKISTLICPSFDLSRPDTWGATHERHRAAIDLVAAAGGGSIYFPSGRTTGATWTEVLSAFADAVAPSRDYGKTRGVTVAVEPTPRTDVSFITSLRDGVHLAEKTGLSLIVDFGNMWMERDSREVLTAAMPHVALVQICDAPIGAPGRPPPNSRCHVGDGELPLRRLMEETLDAGYAGVFDLETLGSLIEAEGYDSALRRGVATASQFLADMGV